MPPRRRRGESPLTNNDLQSVFNSMSAMWQAAAATHAELPTFLDAHAAAFEATGDAAAQEAGAFLRGLPTEGSIADFDRHCVEHFLFPLLRDKVPQGLAQLMRSTGKTEEQLRELNPDYMALIDMARATLAQDASTVDFDAVMSQITSFDIRTVQTQFLAVKSQPLSAVAIASDDKLHLMDQLLVQQFAKLGTKEHDDALEEQLMKLMAQFHGRVSEIWATRSGRNDNTGATQHNPYETYLEREAMFSAAAASAPSVSDDPFGLKQATADAYDALNDFEEKLSAVSDELDGLSLPRTTSFDRTTDLSEVGFDGMALHELKRFFDKVHEAKAAANLTPIQRGDYGDFARKAATAGLAKLPIVLSTMPENVAEKVLGAVRNWSLFETTQQLTTADGTSVYAADEIDRIEREYRSPELSADSSASAGGPRV